jgi:hypothetical protein
MNLLDSALSYADRGWRIFPLHTPKPNGACSCRNTSCKDIGKHPHYERQSLEHGLNDATTNPDQIRHWWGLWQDANPAIRTGAESGIVVLDVDPRHNGDETLARLELDHGPLPETVEVVTGGGGRHLYFRYPEAETIRSSNGEIGEGLDVKATGGYVVAPPALHASGQRYAWELSGHPDDVALAEIPVWLLALMRKGGGSAPEPDGDPTGGKIDYLGYPTLEFIAFGAPKGQQRNRACAAARALLSVDRSVDEAIDKVWEGLAKSECGDPADPWTRAHAEVIVRDIARREPTPLADWPEIEIKASRPHQITADARPLDEIIATFQRWLYLPEPGPLYAALGTVAANLMAGDPVWTMLVGASSGGKTEILNSTSHLPHVFMAATLTEGALLSATPKRDKAASSKGGLLREIGPFGILLLKDFTSILSMNRDPRAALLAAFREIYDGSWTRHVGVDGGRTLHWEGKVGLVGGCTATIDAHHAVMAMMGERFLLHRLPDIDPQEQGRQSLRNTGKEQQMRAELAEAVAGLFAGLELPDGAPELPKDKADQIVALASLAARGRSGVERNGYTREIELVADSEAPARLAQALRRLYGGLLVIGAGDELAWQVALKTGLDCMPKLRRAVFDFLTARQSDKWVTTKDVATTVDYPTQTARRALEDLAVHGITRRVAFDNEQADYWKLSRWARVQLAIATGEPVPEMSEDEEEPDHRSRKVSKSDSP